MEEKQRQTPLFLMALTILIDFTGFGLIIPLLPFWAEHLGANSFGVGLIITSYALAQFIFTPLLGSLSDRYGRRPVILMSLIIETIALIFTALASAFPLLLLARFVGGLGASNIGSAQAVVSDITTPKNRTRGMGMIGAAIGLGFVIGPALGGLLSTIGPTIPFWTAAAIALLNAILVFFFLPETRTRAMRELASMQKKKRSGNVVLLFMRRWQGTNRLPAIQIIARLILVNLLFTVAFASMETIFPLFSQKQFGWGTRENAYIFTYIGIIVILMQGGIVSQLVKRWNEQLVMFSGLILLAIGLLLLSVSSQLAFVLLSIGIISIGDGAVTPNISTLLSFATPSEQQGETLGLAQGFAGLGRVIGPLIAGSLAASTTYGTPMIAGGILMILATIIVLPVLSRIHPPRGYQDQGSQHVKPTDMTHHPVAGKRA